MKLQLPNITLLIYNPDKSPDLSAKVLNFVCGMIDFGAVKHLCNTPPTIECVGEYIHVPFDSWEEGQKIQAYGLYEHINPNTDFILHVETDGYPVNPHLWEDEFLKWDYCGAPWPTGHTMNNRVGNGGVSLRSRKFLKFMWDNQDKYLVGQSSDIWFCQQMFEEAKKAGLTYAPLDVALRFSYELPIEEREWDWTRSFAYHGLYVHLREPFNLIERK